MIIAACVWSSISHLQAPGMTAAIDIDLAGAAHAGDQRVSRSSQLCRTNIVHCPFGTLGKLIALSISPVKLMKGSCFSSAAAQLE